MNLRTQFHPADLPAALPPGSWDTHVPLRADVAPLAQLPACHRRWGVAGVVLVQSGAHGVDIACLLDALRALGPRARGVAMVDPVSVREETLADMQAAGVVGMRVDLFGGIASPCADPFWRLADRLRGSGLFLQIDAPLERILDNARTLETAGVPVVLDRFAGLNGTHRAADVAALTRLCRNAPIWLKLQSGAGLTERSSALARERIAAFWSLMPDRMFWGSGRHAGAGDTPCPPGLRLLAEAGLDRAARTRILTDNPAALLRTTGQPRAAPTRKTTIRPRCLSAATG